MMEDMDLGLLLRSALSIDDIDQLRMPPSDGMSIIWVDISERPDLGVFAYPPETVYSFRGDMQKPPISNFGTLCSSQTRSYYWM